MNTNAPIVEEKLLISELTPLLQKYSKPGPRYTSYPTAPCFTTAYSAEQHSANIQASDSELSLYFHLPFCDTLCYFCGCTMLVSNNRDRIAEYLDHLEREIDRIGPLVRHRKVGQVHWGGGTPTHLLPREIRQLGEKIRTSFNIAADAEISVEIDPREVSFDHISALADAGFTRGSIGVQDIDPRVQKAINRIQPIDITQHVIDWCRYAGFTSINVDLIYGLPLQTKNSFRKTIDRVLTFDPDRLALYNFAYVPWLKPHQKLISIGDLPESEEKLSLFVNATQTFLEHGYEYIGMDHFAKPQDELCRARAEGTLQRNFQGYSTRAGRDLIGLGMSAISHANNSFAQNAKTLQEYYSRLDKQLLPTIAGLQMTNDDIIREHVIMRLMCDLRLDKTAVTRRFGIDFNEYFDASLQALGELEADGLLVHTPNSIEITESGRFFIRNIAMCFDAYLEDAGATKPVFSKTI